jgi:hypothetical protein
LAASARATLTAAALVKGGALRPDSCRPGAARVHIWELHDAAVAQAKARLAALAGE